MILASIALAGATSNPNALLVGQQAITQQTFSAEEMNKKQIDWFRNMVAAGFDPKNFIA